MGDNSVMSRMRTPVGGVISKAGRRLDNSGYLNLGWKDTPGPGKY